MKFKYYLRGLGMGIIVATLIMTVSSVIHNNNLSEETIIKEALKLGMVMPEETENTSSLWGNTQTTEQEDTQTPMDTQVPADTQTPTDTQIPTDTQTPTETEASVINKVPEGTWVEITVEEGDAARQVAEKLYEKGLIEDAEDFRQYLGTTGYASRISNGTFQIPMGATYDEIIAIIIL